MAYIYQITNKINQKIYIGKTEFSIEKRFKEHCNDAYNDKKEKRPLYAAMRKYGIENFEISLIEETDNPEEREIYWIEQKRSFKNGFNATIGGDGRKYLDYDLVIATYEKVKNTQKVADILNYDYGHIRNILHQYNYNLTDNNNKDRRKVVAKCDKTTNEILEVFPSIMAAAKSINKHTHHISDCINNKRKSAYGYAWHLIDD